MLPKIIKEKRQRQALRSTECQQIGATGCICPPTAEQTCKSPTCPRKDHRTLGQKMKDANR